MLWIGYGPEKRRAPSWKAAPCKDWTRRLGSSQRLAAIETVVLLGQCVFNLNGALFALLHLVPGNHFLR
jgi:hypothetical protein